MNNDSININIDTLEDLLWMSCRYSMGRKTIHTLSLPSQLLKIYDNLPKHIVDRLIGILKNDLISNIKIDYNISQSNLSESSNDILTNFFECIEGKSEDEINNLLQNTYIFIDTSTKTLTSVPSNKKNLCKGSINDLLSTYGSWIKLINIFNKRSWVYILKTDKSVVSIKEWYIDKEGILRYTYKDIKEIIKNF